MDWAYRISTLLYCFSRDDEILLLYRNQEPNLGVWSPCGGKLDLANGESPYACACREAAEEMGMILTPRDLHMTGIVSEQGCEGQPHWLMFLFEVTPKLNRVPEAIREGKFEFFTRNNLAGLAIPKTDREMIWPLFWQHRGGFFAAHCHCREDGTHEWRVEASHPAAAQRAHD